MPIAKYPTKISDGSQHCQVLAVDTGYNCGFPGTPEHKQDDYKERIVLFIHSENTNW